MEVTFIIILQIKQERDCAGDHTSRGPYSKIIIFLLNEVLSTVGYPLPPQKDFLFFFFFFSRQSLILISKKIIPQAKYTKKFKKESAPVL